MSSSPQGPFPPASRGDRYDNDNDGDGAYDEAQARSSVEPTSWRDPRIGHAHQSRLERTIEAIGMGRYQLHLLLLTGMGWAADNAWMTAIPMVLPAVQTHFNVSDRYSGALSSSCFFGMMVGSLAWGSYSDTYGRLPSFTYTLAITTLFAIILPFSPTFSFLCFSLFLLGSGLGGSMPTDGTIFLENTPKSKQYLTVALSTFFSAGAAVSSAWAIIVMPCRASAGAGDQGEDACKGSWRWRIYLAGLAVLTACFFLSRIFLFTLHESPRYLVSQGRTAEARRVLQHIVDYNDTTEQEALDALARSAEPGTTALTLRTEKPRGFVSRLVAMGRAFVTGDSGLRAAREPAWRGADRDSGTQPKDTEGRSSESSESPDEEYVSNGRADLEVGNGGRKRPRALDRGMSVRLSDVYSWSSSHPSKMKLSTQRARPAAGGIPSVWRTDQADDIEEQEAAEELDRALDGVARGRRADGKQSWERPASSSASLSPTKAQERAREREGLLTGPTSGDQTPSYHDDSVPTGHPSGSTSSHPPGEPGGHSSHTAPGAPAKPTTIQERIEVLLSPRWRRTTALTWAIWTSLNLGYTMLNVFLPKILEERASSGRADSPTPPSTQSQSSDAEALWSYFAYALASIPGPLVASYLVETPWLGRRGTLALSLGCTSALMLLLSSVLGSGGASTSSGGGAGGGGGGGGFGTTSILVLISFGATTAYAALYGYTPELFAIELRGTACGVASAAGRLAGVMAPMVGGWLLGRSGGDGSARPRSSGPGALCGLSAGLLAITAALTLALPREDLRPGEPSKRQGPNDDASSGQASV